MKTYSNIKETNFVYQDFSECAPMNLMANIFYFASENFL